MSNGGSQRTDHAVTYPSCRAAGLAVARLREASPSALEGSSALTWVVVFLVVDLFLGLSVGALSFTQARPLFIKFYPHSKSG